MRGNLYRASVAAVLLWTGTVSADSQAEREGLAAIARDLDTLSAAVQVLEEKNTGTSNGGTRFRFDHLRIRIIELEETIRDYLVRIESEPRRTWRIDVKNATAVPARSDSK